MEVIIRTSCVRAWFTSALLTMSDAKEQSHSYITFCGFFWVIWQEYYISFATLSC